MRASCEGSQLLAVRPASTRRHDAAGVPRRDDRDERRTGFDDALGEAGRGCAATRANRDGGDPAEQRDRQPRQERRSGHDRTSGSFSTVNRRDVVLELPAMSLAVTTRS